MPRFARIQDGVVFEIIDFDPAGLFHPSLVWVEIGDEVSHHWTYDGSRFAPPPPLPERRPESLADLRAQLDSLQARIHAAIEKQGA